MAKQFERIEAAHREFIDRQRVFFVASAAAGSHVNCSPRSTDSLRVLGPDEVVYLDRTGSGNETAAHIRAGGRVTLMFCAFDGPPLILRLYGQGVVHRRGSARFEELIGTMFGEAPLGTRQLVGLRVARVQTSCGFGVPLLDYRAERPALDRWSATKGEEGLLAYQREKNQASYDGLPTGLFEPA